MLHTRRSCSTSNGTSFCVRSLYALPILLADPMPSKRTNPPMSYLPSTTDAFFLRSRFSYPKRQHGALTVTPPVPPQQRANRLPAYCRTLPGGKRKTPRQYLSRSCSWARRWGCLFCRRRRRVPCCFSWKVCPGRRRSKHRG